MEELKRLFQEIYGRIINIHTLEGGGGSRKYYRIEGATGSIVGVIGDDIKENESFFKLNEVLRQQNIYVPEIIAISPDRKHYLIEDLGDTSLFHLLSQDTKISLAKKALSELLKIQTINEKNWGDKVSFPAFSRRLVMWDLNYFKYEFLKPAGINFDEEKLEDDFETLSVKLLDPSIVTGFMYRDFQSRNIMVKDERYAFIDFQGARKGPIAYDAVSFIWQAKAPFSFEEREDLCRYYAQESAKLLEKDALLIENQISLMEIFRTLQVLGAYGFRGLIERKPHFIESLPAAISNLKYIRSKGLLDEYPELARITDSLSPEKYEKENLQEGKLILTVFSFSYKKGYPEDRSGNGGGFMFDCRAIHNPGRYEEYKSLTGRDEAVIKFLEQTKEASEFIDNAIKIVSPSIERYMKRGFTSLNVGFGCTGGRHRSVYCAQQFAKTVKEMYPMVIVKIIHREQKIEEEL